ncbi:hypothetical protein [Mycobacterium asiaticum]|uniref:Uncharacterized protein n=1 Tax=Mycobacterium asiaticum TaxID=1790 RepID=A0A1A3KYM1_MYCAS|nr:hypothetical protein [Mycobacterium asiaticum]OBJ90322.1 hypothetical protein A5640_02885 [Mycobacterium asiaticum]
MLGIGDMLGMGDIDGILGIGFIPGAEGVEFMQGILFMSSFIVFILASMKAQQSFVPWCQLEGANNRNAPAAMTKIPTAIPVTARVGYSQRVHVGRVLLGLVGPVSVTGSLEVGC